MAYKRTSAVVTVKNGYVVKSYGYKLYRPAGKLFSILKTLDRWAVDEICIIDISLKDSPCQETLNELSRAKVSTPIIYGGGIAKLEHADRAINAGCERFILGRSAYRSSNLGKEIALVYGAQSIIVSLPLSNRAGKLYLPDYLAREISIEKAIAVANESWVSEVFLTDFKNEGARNAFDIDIVTQLKQITSHTKDLILFGGISKHIAKNLLTEESIKAICIGNMNLEHEVHLPKLRDQIKRSIICGGIVR